MTETELLGDVGHQRTRVSEGRRCPRCQGCGVTFWAAFVSGLAWLIAGWLGETVETPPCSRCRGTGRG